MSALSPGKSNKRDPTVLNYCYSSPSYERGREGGCIAYFHHLSQNDRGRWKGRKEERDAANNDRGGMSHWRPFHQIHSSSGPSWAHFALQRERGSTRLRNLLKEILLHRYLCDSVIDIESHKVIQVPRPYMVSFEKDPVVNVLSLSSASDVGCHVPLSYYHPRGPERDCSQNKRRKKRRRN